jgi:hypothetical protein
VVTNLLREVVINRWLKGSSSTAFVTEIWTLAARVSSLLGDSPVIVEIQRASAS